MDFQIPDIARGTIVPHVVHEKERQEDERNVRMAALEQIALNTQEQLRIMQEQVERQQKESQEAKKEAAFSKAIAIISLLFSIAVGIIPLIL